MDAWERKDRLASKGSPFISSLCSSSISWVGCSAGTTRLRVWRNRVEKALVLQPIQQTRCCSCPACAGN